MKLKSVTIQGLHKVDSPKTYTFEDLTYLCGPNGSGKSTILQAIQLGLLGYVPGTNKTASAIFSHSNGSKIEIVVKLIKSSDSDPKELSITRTFTKSGAKIVDDLKVSPQGYDINAIIGNLELPILNFNEFLSLTANKQKDLMMSILPGAISEMDTETYLHSLSGYCTEVEDSVNEIATMLPKLKSIDDVKQLNQLLKDLQSQLNAEDKRTASTIQSLVFYDDYIGESDVEALQATINALMLQRDEALTREANAAQYDSAKSKLAEFDKLQSTLEVDSTYLNLLKIRETLSSKIEEYNKAISDTKAKIADYKAEYTQNQKVIDSNGICPFIEYNCEKIETKISELSESNVALQVQIETLTQEIKDNESNIQLSSNELFEVQNSIDHLSAEYKSRDSLVALLQSMNADLNDEASTETSSELSAKLQALNADLVKAAANQKYNELMEVIQKQKFELDAQITYVKAAVKTTGENGLQSDLMAKPFKQIENVMQKLLIDLGLGDLGQVKFNLEAKANSFNFGVQRDKFIGFELLSSGEKCIFTLAFMCAILKMSNSNISFILIDDLFDHLDDSKFETVNANVKQLCQETQIIIAGVNKPVGEDKYIIDVGENND
jgi:DNA repair exonuclease SbcCD ATPase subunit